MTTPDTGLISAATREIVQQSQSLGLSWTLRMATIVSSTATSGSTIIFDGDTVAISATNMTGGRLIGGDRVYCIIVPQSGNFIVGFAELAAGALLGRVDSTTVNVSDNVAELVVLTTPTITFTNGRAFRVRYRLNTRTSGGANNQAIVRFRAGTGTSGTIWAAFAYSNLNGFGAEARYGEFYLKNTNDTFGSTVTMTVIASLSIQVAVTASTTDVVFLEVSDAGQISNSYDNTFEI
jgi:hypothetical protein